MNSPSAFVVLTTILGCPSTGSAVPVQTATIPLESRTVVIESVRPQQNESCDIDDFVANLEKDAGMKEGMSAARKWLENGFHPNDRHTLQALRLRKGYSQLHLATLVGLKQPNISAIESGKRRPEYATAKRIAEALNITTEELFSSLDRIQA